MFGVDVVLFFCNLFIDIWFQYFFYLFVELLCGYIEVQIGIVYVVVFDDCFDREFVCVVKQICGVDLGFDVFDYLIEFFQGN